MNRPMPVPGRPPDIRFRGRAGRVLQLLVRAACPPDLDELGLTADVVRHIEESIAYAPSFVAHALDLGLFALDAAAIADGPRHKTFSQLRLDEARKYVDEAPRSRNLVRREVIRQVRMLALMGYYEQPRIKERLGYDPDAWIAKVKAERLRRHADDL